LRRVAERNLADAQVEAISTDLRFSAAYHAALALATIPLHCAGYRTRGAAHHATTFQALPLVMQGGLDELAGYFDVCRAKRNQLEYRRSDQATVAEVEELVESVREFEAQIVGWLHRNHPELSLE
jgi:hypothetical protein